MKTSVLLRMAVGIAVIFSVPFLSICDEEDVYKKKERDDGPEADAGAEYYR
jgi:hypothetical protein